MQLQLITLHGIKVDDTIYELIIPTAAGEIAVFPGHEPLVTLAVPGVAKVRYNKEDDDSRMHLFALSGGVVEINQQKVRVLVDEADHGEDIIEAESQAALDLALKMRDDAKDQVDLDKAHQLIDRHQVRLKVAELRRRRR